MDSIRRFIELAEFPDEVRQAALLVAGRPSSLTRISRLQQQSNERFERLLKGRGAAERADIYAVVGVPGVVDILVATIDAEPDKLAEDLAHHPPSVVVAHPGAMEALTYDLGGTVLLAQHWEEDPSMVLKQIEVLQSVSTAPAIAGPYAAVAADYHARYAYTPEASGPSRGRASCRAHRLRGAVLVWLPPPPKLFGSGSGLASGRHGCTRR